MNKNQIYLSTIDPKAQDLARTYGLGLEIAEFCTAWNMDEGYGEVGPVVERKVAGIQRRVFHAPFNELFPCAIDPKARALARERYRQALDLAKQWGARGMVVHGGFHPYLYYPEWYVEQSILFWKEFLIQTPACPIWLENVLEPEPGLIRQIIQGVDSPYLGMCLDVGHVNVYSHHSVEEWIRECAGGIRHTHIHNNDGSWDTHSPLTQGSIPMKQILGQLEERCPEASMTLELMDGEESVKWLWEE